MKKKIFVILCPGDPGRDYLFENQPKASELYLGGDIRMHAASKIANQYPLVIVVGGSEKRIDGMKIYLMRYGVNPNKIIRLESNPDTNGNLNALKKIINHDDYSALKDYKLVLFSNKYHSERTKIMARDILKGIEWEYFSAEDYLVEESRIIGKIYSQQLRKRKKLEKQGVKDWGDNIYKDQGVDSWKFKSIIRDQKILESLIKSNKPHTSKA